MADLTKMGFSLSLEESVTEDRAGVVHTKLIVQRVHDDSKCVVHYRKHGQRSSPLTFSVRSTKVSVPVKIMGGEHVFELLRRRDSGVFEKLTIPARKASNSS